MLPFCGQDKCSVDANGRIKLSPRLIEDFMARCSGEVVMHCLPEGAIALYPEKVFLEMRRQETQPMEKIGSSLVLRRSLRRFGAMSLPDKITRQGRLTIPASFRAPTLLTPGADAYVIGIEIGAEIWNAARWNEEMELIARHQVDRGEFEMNLDLRKGSEND